METHVFLAVMLAALLHAGWNALVKGGARKHVNMAAVIIGHLPLALMSLALAPAPAPESWPWIGAGIVLHAGYQFFLLFAYQAGDFSQVYPLARGSAPLIVTAVSVAFLGIMLAAAQLVAVLLIAGGILSLTLVRGTDGLRAPRAVVLALVTGMFTAGYTLADGLGARLSDSPLAFFAWIALGNAMTFGAFMLWRHPADLYRLPRTSWKVFLVGGSASFTAFAISVWAFTQAPIALVAALRETSIVFALLIGALVFRERMGAAKLGAVAMTLGGAVLLRLAG